MKHIKNEDPDISFYVFTYDRTNKKLEQGDIFKHAGLKTKLIENIKNREITTKESLKSGLDCYFLSKYWSRCEYELIITPWPSDHFVDKIDVYGQLKPNLDALTYLIIHKFGIDF